MSIFLRQATLLTAVTLLIATLVVPTPTQAEEKKKMVTTTVTVGEMCAGCVKAITAHFDKVKEVAKIKCNIDSKTVVLFPAKDNRLSPKKVWETMVSIGKEPKKLVSLSGTFTSKPK